MADIRLAKPAAGATQNVPCEPEARFVFDFPTSDATLAREGDNLNIQFADGASLQLEGFYQEYNEENLPSFNIDGTEVAAADFFQAMNEPDLMPAAGPGTGTTANGARFHEWGDSSLTTGIDHLNGLDWGFSRAFEWEDHPNAVGYHHDDDGFAIPVDHPVTITPPREPDVEIPPVEDPESPDFGIPRDVLLVKEKDLRDGGTATRDGQMKVDAPDGVGEIVIDDVTVWANGRLVEGAEITVKDENGADAGTLTVTGYNPHTGILSYTATLPNSLLTHDHDDPETDEILRLQDLSLTVRDVDGDEAEGRISIFVQDDVPEFTQTTVHVKSEDKDVTIITSSDDDSTVSRIEVDGDTIFQDKANLHINFMDGFEGGVASDAQHLKDLGFSTVGRVKGDAFNDDGSLPSVNVYANYTGGISYCFVNHDNPGNIQFEMTASFVHYQYQAGIERGTLDADSVVNVIDVNNILGKADKTFTFDTENGLSVGGNMTGAWNNKVDTDGNKVVDISTGANVEGGIHICKDASNTNVQKLTNAYGEDILNSNLAGANVSEAVVFNLYDIAYGVDLNLGMEAGDKVLVTLLMTSPRNNNDNIVEKLVLELPEEIPSNGVVDETDTYRVLWQNGGFRIEYEGGFTKMFVSALGSGKYTTNDGLHAELTSEGEEKSGFTIKEVQFLTYKWETSGQVEAESADGVTYDWNLTAFGDWNTAGAWVAISNSIHVKGMEGDDYSVDVVWDDARKWTDGAGNEHTGAYVGTLKSDNGKLHGNELFIAGIVKEDTDGATDAAGTWYFTQFYEFTMKGDVVDPFKITATDGDGDTTDLILDMNAHFLRFEEVRTGHYEEAWSTDVSMDQSDDVMLGADGGSLLYGKGGDDFIMGDQFVLKTQDDAEQGGTAEGAAQPADGTQSEESDPVESIVTTIANLAEEVWEGPGSIKPEPHNGQTTVDKLLTDIDALSPANLDRLGSELERHESTEGGADLIYGGVGDDIALGMAGDDILYGETGNDILFGGSGNDYLDGGEGQDKLVGGSGDDILVGGSGGTELVAGVNANIAFLVDVSNGNDFDAAQAQLAQLFSQMREQYADNPGEVNILLMGFHSYATQTVSVNIHDADAWETLQNGLDDIAGAGKITSDREQKVYDLAANSSNHELAFNYAQGWFEQQDNTGVNKTYLLSTQPATSHMYSDGKPYDSLFYVNTNGGIGVINISSLQNVEYNSATGEVALIGYQLGEEFPLIGKDGVTYAKVNRDGLLEFVKDGKKWVSGELLPGKKDLDESGFNDEVPTPLMLRYDADRQTWILAAVGGAAAAATGTSPAHAGSSFADLSTESSVTLVGEGTTSESVYPGASQTDSVDDILATLPAPTYKVDTLLGGEGDDILFGDAVPEALAGKDVEAIQHEVMGGDADKPGEWHVNESFASAADGGRAENDTLLGGDGNDILFGGAGNDFLDGGAGKDWIYAGAGDDLIVYDPNDYLIDGGSGIDFLLAAKDTTPPRLADMIQNYDEKLGNDMPMVHDVEVMLKGIENLDSLTSMDTLAARYGFTLATENGRQVLKLDKFDDGVDTGWKSEGDNTYSFYENGEKTDITLETTLQQASTDEVEQAAQTIVLTSNG